MCCTTEDRFSAEAEAFEYHNVQINCGAHPPQNSGKKVVGFLNDKFHIVALFLGIGTKMHHKIISRSFCTLDDQGHFCASVGGVRTRMLPSCSQYFLPFLGTVQPPVAWILVTMSHHWYNLSPICCSEI